MRLGAVAALYGAPLLVVDIDACVLADPAGFLTPLSAAVPLALQHTPGNLARVYDGVGGGLVVVRPEPAALALFDRIGRFLLSWVAQRRLHWFLDQIALVAGIDDAQARGAAPGILAVGHEGRLYRCGSGVFAQILGEKSEPDFPRRVESLLRCLRDAAPAAEPHHERARVLTALGIPV